MIPAQNMKVEPNQRATKEMPKSPTREPTTRRQTAITLGFWSAVLASMFTIFFIVLAVGTTLVFPSKAWSGVQTYAENFNLLEMASFIPAFLLAPTVVVLMACIHYVTSETKKVFSLIGLAFASVYAAIIPTNYYLQLFVVRLNLESGALDGLALLAQPNFHSVFFALETLGYAFLSLATLFVSQVFSGGKLESWIRGLLIVSGAVGIFGVLVAPFDQPYLIFAGLGIWSLAFPISTILLGIFYRRAQKRCIPVG
jgi:hypothetical protein